MVNIFTSSYFDRSYKKLPEAIKLKAEAKEKIFAKNPFHAILRTHKLHGKDKEHWAYWVDNKYRIKFLFLNGNKVLYLDVGTHEEVY